MSTVVEAVLVVHSGPDSGQTIPLTGSSIVMGRGLDYEVVVSDRGVSRNHAVLVRPEAGYHLRDLSSTNGTFLNDERIDDRDHLLRNSDTIGFGQGDVSYVYHSPTAKTIRLTLEPTTDVLPVTAAETIAQVDQADEPHAQDERGQTSMDDEIYEGTVRLKVQAEGSVGLMVGFVQRLGDNPDCRVLRLLGDARGGVEAWLKLRTPVSLREWLGAMDGVGHVSPTEGRDLSPQSGDTPLTVRLKTEDVDSSAERTPCVNCRELLEPNVTLLLIAAASLSYKKQRRLPRTQQCSSGDGISGSGVSELRGVAADRIGGAAPPQAHPLHPVRSENKPFLRRFSPARRARTGYWDRNGIGGCPVQTTKW